MGALVESLLSAVTGTVAMTLSETGGEEPFDMALNLMLKDGVIIFNAEAMTDVTGQSMEGVEWFGIDINDGLGDLLAEAGLGDELDDGSADALDAAAVQADTVLRLADGEVAGMPVAVFEMRVDAGSFMSLAGSADGANGELIARNYIGLDDHYSHRVEIEGTLSLSLSLAGSDGNVSQSAFGVDIDIDLSDFNQAVSVEMPEDAFVFPLAMVMAMSSQAAASQ